jgi:hypothetical protein
MNLLQNQKLRKSSIKLRKSNKDSTRVKAKKMKSRTTSRTLAISSPKKMGDSMLSNQEEAEPLEVQPKHHDLLSEALGHESPSKPETEKVEHRN